VLREPVAAVVHLKPVPVVLVVLVVVVQVLQVPVVQGLLVLQI
jgi:hypothetical protein